jgi:hypothetical protein
MVMARGAKMIHAGRGRGIVKKGRGRGARQ